MAATTNPSSISPVKEASQLDFMRRQLFVTPPAVKNSEVDLKDKVIIITGGNSGLGFHSGSQLLSLGLSRLIITARDETKGADAQKLLAKGAPAGAAVEVWPLDLAKYGSVIAFVDRVKGLDRLDAIILNAAAFTVSFRHIPQTGHEELVQINCISNALLTILLLSVLKAKNAPHPTRIVWVNSETAAWAKFQERDSVSLFAGLDKKPTGSFDWVERYYTSKLLCQLFVIELAKRVNPRLAEITMVNPGFCWGTNLHHETTGIGATILGVVKRVIGRSTPVGARTITDSAVKHGPEVHGQYLGDCVLKP